MSRYDPINKCRQAEKDLLTTECHQIMNCVVLVVSKPGTSGFTKASCQDEDRVQSLNPSNHALNPVGRIHRLLRNINYNKRVGAGAPVYLALVFKYLSPEVLEFAGNYARDNKKSRIISRHL